MSDYTKTTDFGAKDALASGLAAKVVKGSEIDDEFDNIATAVATKYDSTDRGAANGIASLDSGGLILAAELPAATESAVGALEIATTAEANARTATDKILVPSLIDGFMDTWAADASGGVAALQTFADPDADEFFGWDDSAGAWVGFTVGTGLAFNATPGIELDFLGIEDLTDPGADSLMAWDDTAGAAAWFTTADGLSFDNGASTIGITDVAAGAAQPVNISSGTFTFDLSSITEIAAPDLDQAADGVLVNDAGTIKVLPIDQAGLLVVDAADAIQTFALTDANTLQSYDSTTSRVWTIPANASVAFEIGTVILISCISTGVITVTADTGVTLMSIFNSAGTTATSDTMLAGGTAALIKVATNEWVFTGDITD